MNKNGVIFLIAWLLLCGWISTSNNKIDLADTEGLRSSIKEARYLLDSPSKEDREYGKIILKNAQNSLIGNGNEDYSAYDPYFN